MTSARRKAALRLGVRQAEERALNLMGRLSPGAAAALDWLEPSKHTSWGGPMNGQRGRQEIVRTLFGSQVVGQVIETGTYRGTTTMFFFHMFGGPVLTVEANPRFYCFARKRLSSLDTVRLSFGDSRNFLDRLSSDPVVTSVPTFFYLDAHWSSDCPLAEEVRLIGNRWADPIIMIDDFAVPGDPGYGYDSYGGGVQLNLDYLPGRDLLGFRGLFPNLRSADETGARRGCVVLARSGRAASIAMDVHGLRLQDGWPVPGFA